MNWSVSRGVVIALGLVVLGCASNKRGPQVTGEYKRYGAEMSQGGMTLPQLPDAALSGMPSVVRFDDAKGYEVEAGSFRLTGKYRFERDSIFLDEENRGQTRLAFAGRLFGDTLHLHWLPDYEVGPDSTEASWELFFARAK